ncbi:hypothetical protein B1F79_02410 [Coxiella-like endosymbiont of Rhipicephalus sanguineus]|nr:hypothetical protein [Coxiella-like endosymbiont of Rhipicephalus sanguineus]
MDEIDYQINDLLNQRAEYALEIVKVKVAEDGKLTKFYRPKRKAEILEKITTQNKGPLLAEAVATIFKSIMKNLEILKLIIIRN